MNAARLNPVDEAPKPMQNTAVKRAEKAMRVATRYADWLRQRWITTVSMKLRRMATPASSTMLELSGANQQAESPEKAPSNSPHW